MNHVFEHLYSPREVLAILIPKLTARGWMHIAVPNPHGLTARLLRSYWIASEPRHVLLYPPQLLVDVLVEAGLSTVNVCFEVVTKDFTRSLRFAIGRAAGIVDSPSMQRPLWTVAALAASRRVADRYHVFASR
jgi:hypothetical protein